MFRQRARTDGTKNVIDTAPEAQLTSRVSKPLLQFLIKSQYTSI